MGHTERDKQNSQRLKTRLSLGGGGAVWGQQWRVTKKAKSCSRGLTKAFFCGCGFFCIVFLFSAAVISIISFCWDTEWKQLAWRSSLVGHCTLHRAALDCFHNTNDIYWGANDGFVFLAFYILFIYSKTRVLVFGPGLFFVLFLRHNDL